MPATFDNPFGSTRAADFTDEQINQFWVDLNPDGEGFFELLKPKADLPMILLGGKGTGKTHLLRYLSLPLQAIRHQHDVLGGVCGEGYVGVYMRCSGLNSARFGGKGQEAHIWDTLFAYHTELSLCQLMLEAARKLLPLTTDPSVDTAIAEECLSLFDTDEADVPCSLEGIARHVRSLQKEIDVKVNNCVFTGQIDVKIRTTPGALVFGVPRAIATHAQALQACKFLYLIDEFENLSETQQKFINTLVREKKPPCSIKIGSKLHGLKTLLTHCDNEENREGSEYETLRLDEKLRDASGYREFANRLIAKRLSAVGLGPGRESSDTQLASFLDSSFARPDTEGTATELTDFVLTKYADAERPYFLTLRKVLERGVEAAAVQGIHNDDIPALVADLKCDRYPLLEKLNCFLFYQRWSNLRDLRSAADELKKNCDAYLKGERGSAYERTLRHFKYDLLAQLLRECDKKQVYAGYLTLQQLSWGNPRHFLMLLKHVTGWAVFKGENPFASTPISQEAQIRGVREAADWFFRDPRIPGDDGRRVREGVARLSELFRHIRYSHKPSECSVCSFSYDPAEVSGEALRLIDIAERHSLLVSIGSGQRDRNSERVDRKNQVTRLLSPIWDIAFYRRGALALTGDEVSSIFDPDRVESFKAHLDKRVARMTAPFFGRSLRDIKQDLSKQQTFPGME